MKKTIRLTESDLSKLIRRVIKEIDIDTLMNASVNENKRRTKRRINVK